jgi:hypothetical protein
MLAKAATAMDDVIYMRKEWYCSDDENDICDYDRPASCEVLNYQSWGWN